MKMLHNDRLIRALNKQSVDKTPIWIMRQAGRYLPEYRKLRQSVPDFMTLCKTPELACEVTLQPIQRFALDAAIIFSDILTIPDAMNLGLSFEENEGPKFRRPIRTGADIHNLSIPNTEDELGYVMQAIRLVKKELANKIPLIGFSGSPWTLATYMVEGGTSKSFQIVKKFLYAEEQSLHTLLSKLSEAVSLYLKAQINAGVNAVMIFDTWGGVLTTQAYRHFSLSYMQKIIQDVKVHHQHIPIIVFTKNGNQWISDIVNSGCDAIGIDWTIELGVARRLTQNKVALQGNMDPAMLYATPKKIQQEVKNILQSYGTGNGHIFNLGHGIFPDVAPENVGVLIEAVHEFSIPYHLQEAYP